MRAPPSVIFSVDPGHVAGWAGIAVSSRVPLIGYGGINFNLKRSETATQRLKRFTDECKGESIAVAIEGQYLGINPDSLIKLCRKAGRWEEAADNCGLPWEYVNPSTWITAELGRGLRSDQIEKLAPQKVYALYARQIGGRKISEHECCAVLIGRYVAIREYRKQAKGAR